MSASLPSPERSTGCASTATMTIQASRKEAASHCAGRPHPPSDDFANAENHFDATSGTAYGSNVAATLYPDESTVERGSIWWLWTAPANGIATFDTHGSNFDTQIGVYTGDAVDALAEVAFYDEYLTASVTFTATAGTVYRIVVGGSYARGSIHLNWSIQ